MAGHYSGRRSRLDHQGRCDSLKMVAYKAERTGKTFVQVDPRGTSQERSCCGEIVSKSLSDRWHNCPYCGSPLSRDHDSSINILQRGIEKVR
ncbi:zinc ribbon domain-containing protein [Methanomassiliicoccus luminyensis]|uniref:zinc ribbon domain-containing protein n=1 Tax=Methanomassiliicoccus luminyensis TaxID=1080712 RepID=UPI0009DAB4F0